MSVDDRLRQGLRRERDSVRAGGRDEPGRLYVVAAGEQAAHE